MMKDSKAPQPPAEGDKTPKTKPASAGDAHIQNPFPLSEKDEVKEAERRMRENQKK